MVYKTKKAVICECDDCAWVWIQRGDATDGALPRRCPEPECRSYRWNAISEDQGLGALLLTIPKYP